MAVGPNTIPAGITGEDCYYYRATAWERQRIANRTEWKQVADESLYVPFFVQDDTGRMLVNPQGADMDVHRNFKDEFGTSFFGNGNIMSDTARTFLLRNGISGGEVRLEEFCIKPEYPLFVFGTLGENSARGRSTPERHVSATSSSINLRLNSRLMGSGLWQMLGGIPGTQTQMDSPVMAAGRSGRVAMPQTEPTMRQPAPTASSSWTSVSMDEVHKPVATATLPAVASASEIAEAQRRPSLGRLTFAGESERISAEGAAAIGGSRNSVFDLSAPVAIGKGDAGAPFTISSESQRELVRALAWKSAACIWGGPALTVTCVYILMLTLGWL
jgi:hypothetical protein